MKIEAFMRIVLVSRCTCLQIRVHLGCQNQRFVILKECQRKHEGENVVDGVDCGCSIYRFDFVLVFDL